MQLINKAMLSSSAILVLTILHHYYGAIIYSTPWRAHVVFYAGPALLMLGAAWLVYRSSATTFVGNIAKGIFVLLAAIVAVGIFGIYEGGYNHLLKDVLYFGGASSETLSRLFPPPTYEMPNDVLFEITGVAQFFVAVWATYNLVAFLWRAPTDLDGVNDVRTAELSGGASRNV